MAALANAIATCHAKRVCASMAGGLSFVDSHCHLQDPRFCGRQVDLLKDVSSHGVKWLVVNGTSEDDWASVHELAQGNRQIVPSFGLHPWFVNKRSSEWLSRLRSLLEDVPNAAVGETGLDKSTRGKAVDMETQVEVLRQQLQLAKDLQRPVAVHCVKAFGPLEQLVKEMGPFPAGLILHSYAGSAEMVNMFADKGAYFSFSGLITGISSSKARNVLQAVPDDRLLLETDCPDALPKVDGHRLASLEKENEPLEGTVEERDVQQGGHTEGNKTINHPSNIRVVAEVVAGLLDRPLEDVCNCAYQNAVRVFSYSGSQVV